MKSQVGESHRSTKTMAAYHLDRAGSMEGLVLRTHPIPTPGKGEVLVRLKSAALEARDIAVIYDRYVHAIPTAMVPLSNGAGEVVDVGPGVGRFKAGDRVVPNILQRWIAGPRQAHYSGSGLGGSLDGTLRTHALFGEEGLVHLPSHLSWLEGAALGLSALSAWVALSAGRPLRPGDTVLVQGSGNIALLAIQLAKQFGATVIVTTRRGHNRERLGKLGADVVINVRETPDWLPVVNAATRGRGVSVVVDVIGATVMQDALDALSIDGRLSTIGNLGGPGLIDPAVLIARSKVIAGVAGGSRHQLEELMAAVAGTGMRPLIDSSFSFGDAKSAIEHFERGDRFGRIVIDMDRLC